MPPYILVADRGPEPYRPPAVDYTAHVAETRPAAEAGRVEVRRGREWRRVPAHADDVMTSPVLTLGPDEPLSRAWSLVRERGVRHIPVLSDARALVGILTDRDLLRGAPSPRHNPPGNARRSPPARVADLMSRRIVAATADTPVADLARVLIDERIGGIPILDAANGLVGLVTRTDVLRYAITRETLDLTG